MTVKNRTMKWLPALVAPVVVAGVVAAPAFASGADASETHAAVVTSTPSAADVLASIAKSTKAHYSGTIQQTSELGLPELPAGMTGSSEQQASGILELLTAPHKARVYADGPSKQRLQVLDSLAERDVVRNGTSVWIWDSSTQKATHVTLPSKSAQADGDSGAPATPAQLAAQLVKKAGEDSTLTVSKTSVASRSAWRLTITPKTSDTLVAKANIAVDTKTGVPLSAAIDARGQKTPAATVAFTTIDFAKPAASNFEFTPPKGASVTKKSLPSRGTGHASHPDNRVQGSFEGPSVVGSGWSAILAVPAGALGPGMSGLTADQSHLLAQLSQPVEGGRGLQTSLFSVLLTNDGRMYAGAVPLSALEAAAR